MYLFLSSIVKCKGKRASDYYNCRSHSTSQDQSSVSCTITEKSSADTKGKNYSFSLYLRLLVHSCVCVLHFMTDPSRTASASLCGFGFKNIMFVHGFMTHSYYTPQGSRAIINCRAPTWLTMSLALNTSLILRVGEERHKRDRERHAL